MSWKIRGARMRTTGVFGVFTGVAMVIFLLALTPPAYSDHGGGSTADFLMEDDDDDVDGGEIPASIVAGAWIVDAGPDQIKTVTTYTPIGGGPVCRCRIRI
jgi:hypothetical protein